MLGYNEVESKLGLINTIVQSVDCSLISCNITSLHTQLDAVAALSGDVMALQETRLSEIAQLDMTKNLAKLVWKEVGEKVKGKGG